MTQFKLPPVPHGALPGSLMHEEFTAYALAAVAAYKTEMAKQEPVAKIVSAGDVHGKVEWLVHSGRPASIGQALYTLPAQQPLNHRLLSALAGLLEQVEKFTAKHGEADFETAEALAAVEAGANAEAPAQQPLSEVRTLSPAQIERHMINAGECPSGSEVLLVSTVRRLLGHGIGGEK